MAHAKNHDYHILPPSIWPFATALSMFVMLFGAAVAMKGNSIFPALIGGAGLIFCLFAWFSNMTREGQTGDHTPVVRIGLRYGFIFFVTSEIMFFVAWFWAYFKSAMYPMAQDNMSPWVDGAWPPVGVEFLDPWHLPLINTLILLCSGAACTWAHHAMTHNKRRDAALGLIISIVLGLCFTAVQGFEYYEAVHHYFSFSGNIYGATFFMATGFHGVHIIIGAIMLFVALCRLLKGHFTPDHHVGFETAAWYWHFVDVVWLFLFVAVYIWGSNPSEMTAITFPFN